MMHLPKQSETEMTMDMMSLMKNLPAMLGQMKEMQNKLGAIRIQGSAGGGMVTVTLNGQGEMVDIKLEKEVIDPEDPEMLTDLIIAATADAKKAVAAKVQEEMQAATGGLDLSSLGIDLSQLGIG
jgi:DNA-binding YbaB/EbfC family protein